MTISFQCSFSPLSVGSRIVGKRTLRLLGRSDTLISSVLAALRPLVILFAVLAWESEVVAATTDDNEDLFSMSLEELMNIDIASVSKKSESLGDVAAAAYVITNEDIRRSGARSLPEALKLAPGVDVARINGGTWSIAIRGFNSRLANKLLVLIDGRSVYNPIYAGVFWDTQQVLVEDIDRIEVIRGPGAAIWGPNAVNGVINVITRKADDADGIVAVSDVSTEGDWRGGGSIGHKINDKLSLKLTAFTQQNAELSIDMSDRAFGRPASDEYASSTISFRSDYKASSNDDLSIITQFTDGERQELVFTQLEPFEPETFFVDNGDIGVWSVQGLWTHRFNEQLSLKSLAAYEHFERTELGAEADIENIDIAVDLHASLKQGHALSAGLYYQFDDTNIDQGITINFTPSQRTTENYGGFVHSEWNLFDGKSRLIFGSTFEDNDFTGFEFQPTARALWKPSENQSVWVGLSRSVRTPSRLDRDLDFTLGLRAPGELGNDLPFPALVLAQGNPEQDSEVLWSYEAGYRLALSNRFSIDLTAFYNDYAGLQTGVPQLPTLDLLNGEPIFVVPIVNTNGSDARGLGFELTTRWTPFKDVRVDANYAFLDLDTELLPVAASGGVVLGAGQTPKHQASIQTFVNVTDNLEVDVRGSYRSSTFGETVNIDGFFDLSGRIGWRPIENVELSLVGQQLADNRRLEFEETLAVIPITEAERRVYVRIRLDY
ncbi:MAG: TonB-dependent receptor [Pseudomonadota bacterium]